MGWKMPNNYKVTKMDGRHTGRELFSHYINYNVYVRGGYNTISINEINFLKARVWFWEKFGPSAELGKASKLQGISDEPAQWAWQTEHQLLRIYVTEKALEFFIMSNTA